MLWINVFNESGSQLLEYSAFLFIIQINEDIRLIFSYGNAGNALAIYFIFLGI